MNTMHRRFSEALASALLAAVPSGAWAALDLPGPGTVALAATSSGSVVPAVRLAGSAMEATPMVLGHPVLVAVAAVAIAVLAGLEFGYLMRVCPHGERAPAR